MTTLQSYEMDDYVATNLRGETPINDPLLVGTRKLQPGVIRAVGSTSADVELIFRIHFSTAQGLTTAEPIAIAAQTGSGSISSLSPPSVSLSGNPKFGQAVALLSRPTNNDTVILEFRVTGILKLTHNGGPVTTNTDSDVIARRKWSRTVLAT